MFDNQYPGFESAVVSYVTLLAVSEAIGKVKAALNEASTHILFVIFHGVSWSFYDTAKTLKFD